MSTRKRWLQYLVLAAFLLVVGYTVGNSLFNPDKEATSSALIGEPAPDFSLYSLDGQVMSVAEHIGKPVMINFWASWCEPCRSEMPLLDQKAQQYAAQGLTVLAVNLGESEKTVEGFRDEYGLSFPILLDKDDTVSAQYAIEPIPSTFFIDRTGRVQNVYIGELDEESAEENIQKILPLTNSSPIGESR